MHGPWLWLIWAPVLVLQQAAQTMTSRARSSGSLGYHAVAAVFGNGVWFFSQLVIIERVTNVLASGDLMLAAGTLVFYLTFCTIGSVGMHWILLNRVERGSRRVGATTKEGQ